MAYAVVNKIRVHYEMSGTGDPVLLINGLSVPAVSEHADLFNRAVRRFLKSVRST
jgi:hypothetical protein